MFRRTKKPAFAFVLLAASASLMAQVTSTEKLDLTMYQQIREEGLEHSHVMEFASGLIDGIGPRLTGSPNIARAYGWTRDQLAAMGCSNAHLEDEGEFGLGWQQHNAWLRMAAPDESVFLAQAVPWSPPTKGPIKAPATLVSITDEKDFEAYRGKLAGKIVMLGALRAVPSPTDPLFSRLTDTDLARLMEIPCLHSPRSM